MVFVPWKANVGIFGWRCDSTPCAVLSKRVTFAHSQTRHGSSDGTSSRHFELLATLHRFSVRLSLFFFFTPHEGPSWKIRKILYVHTHFPLDKSGWERIRIMTMDFSFHFATFFICKLLLLFIFISLNIIALSMSTRCLIFPTCGDDEKDELLEKLRVVREELTVDVKEAFGCSHFSSSPHFIPSFARSFFFFALPYFVTFYIFSFDVELLVHPHSSDALFSPPSRLHAYWRVLSRLSSGGNYIIRVWAKWLSRVSIGGVNWAWRLTLDGEGCSAGRTVDWRWRRTE